MKKTISILLVSFLFLLSARLDAQWVIQNSGTTYMLSGIFSTNADTAYAVGYYNASPYNGLVLKTTNGGSTWNPLGVTSMASFSVYFTDANTGYIAAQDTILKTTDAGSSWSKYPINLGIYMSAVYFYNSAIGYAGGTDFNGSHWYIFTTTNGGAAWTPHTIPSSRTRPNSFFATSANTCYFAGGVALKTTDAGTTWDTTKAPGSKDLNSVYFTSTTNGVIVGGEQTSGNIYQTTNAGTSWSPVYTGTKVLTSVYFTNSNTGYAVGDSGTILQTTDGGSTWNPQTSPTIYNLQSVHFADASTGYAVGDSGCIIKYIVPLPVELTSFSATSRRLNVELQWTTATEISNYGFEIERNVDNSWTRVGFVAGNGTSNSPKEYSFIDKNISAVKYSYRLKQIDRDGQFKYSQSVEVTVSAPAVIALEQNFPNPFNPSTTIRYGLPNRSVVKIGITNALGQQVAVLENGEREAGYHEVEWHANVASGIYFYRINAVSTSDPNNRFVQVKKMLFIK